MDLEKLLLVFSAIITSSWGHPVQIGMAYAWDGLTTLNLGSTQLSSTLVESHLFDHITEVAAFEISIKNKLSKLLRQVQHAKNKTREIRTVTIPSLIRKDAEARKQIEEFKNVRASDIRSTRDDFTNKVGTGSEEMKELQSELNALKKAVAANKKKIAQGASGLGKSVIESAILKLVEPAIKQIQKVQKKSE